MSKLPDKIVVLHGGCQDKKGIDDKWNPKEKKKLGFPKVFRALVSGFQNSGKSLWVQNILERNKYKRIFVIQASPDSKDWLKYTPKKRIFFNELPAPERLTKAKNQTAIVFDDVNLNTFSKEDREYITNIVSHISSHYGVAVFWTGQNFCYIGNLTIRCCMNVFVVFNQPNMISAKKIIMERTGIPKHKADQMFELLNNKYGKLDICHNHILVDRIPGNPHSTYRLNSNRNIYLNKDNDDVVLEQEKGSKSSKRKSKRKVKKKK